MKTLVNLLLLAAVLIIAVPSGHAQAYLTITQAHWNWDNEDGNPERWLELEKAWHDNVVMKNEHIIGSGVYHHMYTADNSEVVFVTLYPSWEAIPKAAKRSAELAEAAWPDKEEREKAGKERNNYYSADHSDEIYTTLPISKPLAELSDEPLVYLVVDRHLAFPDDAEEGEMAKLQQEFHENVTHKNPHLLGFYAHRHAWGSDGRDVSMVYVVKSLADLEAMQDAQTDLAKAHWPDDEERKAFFKKLNKYWTPWHSDRIYSSNPDLVKVTAPPTEAAAEGDK